MTPTEKLRNYARELDASEDRMQGERDHKKTILKRAKDDGIDPKALMQARRELKMDPHEREVFEHTVAQYCLDLA